MKVFRGPACWFTIEKEGPEVLKGLRVSTPQHELRQNHKHVSDETAKKHWDFW